MTLHASDFGELRFAFDSGRLLRATIVSDAIQAIEGGDLVAFGHRGVVENRIAEVVDRALVGHHGLTDVDNFRGRFADAMYGEQSAGFAVEHQFEHAAGVADDMSAGDFPKPGHAHFIGDMVGGQLFFGRPDHRDFGDGEQAVGHFVATLERLTKGMAGGAPPLFHRDAG